MKQPSSKPRRNPRKRSWSVGLLAVAALAGWGVFSLTQDVRVGSSSLGDAAMEHARELVAFGPRPSGSQAHQQMQQYILEKLEAAGLAVEQDRFTASTPNGPIEMNNLIARSEGRTDRVIVLATHYETKWEPDFRFVGANDGGSGTALLLALAAELAGRTYNHAVWLVFLDGEEAFREWSDTDSLYGSRHLAAKWKAAGITSRIGAFLLVDMIGDADLGILRDSNSTPWLRDLVWNVARRLGHSRHFLNTTTAISDDHLPFLQAGVPAVDLIDYDYGPGNRYWHTAEDTLDKISPKSLQVVGEVLLGSLDELDRER